MAVPLPTRSVDLIFEFKQYTPHPGKADALRERFWQWTVPTFQRLGIRVVSVFAPRERTDELWYIVAFNDEPSRQAAWAAFAGDAQWQQVKADSERDGPLLASQTSHVLQALQSPEAPRPEHAWPPGLI